MKIIIVGGGAVGELVAQRLIQGQNELIIVEKDQERCDILQDSLDAKIIQGDAASISTLQSAGLITADMMIAVTSNDETNILACLIAQAYSNIGVKVARLRTHEVDKWKSICSSKLLGIDLVIHPDSVAVDRILEVVGIPGVSDIMGFSDGLVTLFGLTIESGSWLVGKRVRELDENDPPVDFLAAMIFRQRRVIIPTGNDYLTAGDHFYVVVRKAEMESALEFFGVPGSGKIKRAFILGGKQLGIEAAIRLEGMGVQVKLFEEVLERCEKISTIVKDTIVVHGDGTDQKLLMEENIKGTDAYLALTNDDEENIIACLLAKRLGVRKSIARVNRIDFLPMAQLLGINSTFSTRLVVVDRILQFIRKGNVVSVTTFREEEAEAIELLATPGSKYIGKKLSEINFPRGALVGAIVRPTGEVIIPRGDSVISLDDKVIFFCLENVVPKLEKAFIY